MEESLSAIASRLEELCRAMCELERRTAALEGRSAREAVSPESSPPLAAEVPVAAVAAESAPPEPATALGPLFGWALMGLAGAYLLRALTEAGAIAGYLGLGTGIVYAAWWLYLAERRAWEKPVFSTVHALTAALILAPMLWEMTVRFRLIGVAAASVVVVLFAVIGLAIAWRRTTSSIAWIVTVTGLLTATALFRDSHDLRAWVATILAIAVAVEVSACRDHWLSLRWIVALAANLSVLILAWLASRPPSPGEVVSAGSGTVLAAQIGLLTIYLASTVDRTIFRGLTISGFEIGQMAVAFAISIGGALHTVGASGGGAVGIGAFCLLGGAACYLVSFAFLETGTKRDRNFYTYSTFGLLLVTAGCQVLLTGAALAAVWAALAAATMSVGFVRNRDTLRVHAAVYLVLAVFSAQLLPLAAGQIARRGADPGHVGAGYLLALAGAVACYAAIVALGRGDRLHWTDRVEAIMVAALVFWGAAGVISEGISAFISPAAPLRTALLTALAIGAAWAAAKWERAELDRIAWPLMGVAGLKLLAEDFAHGQSHSLVVSLILFGGGLILLPRLARAKKATP
jgi:hypothetical protein